MLDQIVQAVLAVLKGRGSAADTARDFYGILRTAADQLADGQMMIGEFVDHVMGQIELLAEEIYQDAAGVGYALEDDDYKLISDFVESQREFIAKLGQDIRKSVGPTGVGEITPQMDERLQMWAKSISTIGGIGYMQSHREQVVVWRRGGTHDACETCVGLDGYVAPLGWFLDNGYLPQQPGSGTLACGGWRCGCGLFDRRTGRRMIPLVKRW